MSFAVISYIKISLPLSLSILRVLFPVSAAAIKQRAERTPSNPQTGRSCLDGEFTRGIDITQVSLNISLQSIVYSENVAFRNQSSTH